MGTLKRLALSDMDAAARIHRSAFDDALPWLAGLHTPEEDRRFFRERVFATCEVWGAYAADTMVGIVGSDPLSVVRTAPRGGIGTALLRVAQQSHDRLSLWTFQRNTPARRFYAARGLRLIRETDGAGNDEKEPDALYLWTRSASG
jgi:hypothetical protein